MKKIFWIFAVLFGSAFAACSEETEVGEFENNWRERNVNYLDSIATIARTNQGSAVNQWKVIQSYHLSSGYVSTDNQDYVFAQIKEVGTGDVSPLYTDSVRVNYRGQLIPTASYPGGRVFDQNYYGELIDEENKKVMVPSTFSLGGVVDGWTTALQQMHVGDIWRIYIPQSLGYGSSTSNSNIPAYSTLVFDVYLREIKK